MRADWNERAREDAHYYVAFGRRDQDDAEFFATATDVVRDLDGEIRRFPRGIVPAARRALEIGCGPGRLMRPMSSRFGEIHGVDISDEMVAQARWKLRDIPHAHVHHVSGGDLQLFASGYFDFVFSYAVFQHIPSADLVFGYLREIVRVLKPGGLARLHINGLPQSARTCNTWDGVRISADEVRAFTDQHGMRLLSLTGVDTQYMWTSWQKPFACRIRQVVNSFSQEPFVPSRGRLASATVEIEHLPEPCDLNSLKAFIDGAPATNSYLGPLVKGITQFDVFLPGGVRQGLLPVRVEWHGQRLCPDSVVRVIPPGPVVPRLISVSDGVNLLSAQRIESRLIKATIEDVEFIENLAATVDGLPVVDVEPHNTDPLALRYEINFALPRAISSGTHDLEIRLGKLTLTRMGIEVA
jgi:ubiquinone/menaquinone biosynthesis C-methylase UbiE